MLDTSLTPMTDIKFPTRWISEGTAAQVEKQLRVCPTLPNETLNKVVADLIGVKAKIIALGKNDHSHFWDSSAQDAWKLRNSHDSKLRLSLMKKYEITSDNVKQVIASPEIGR